MRVPCRLSVAGIAAGNYNGRVLTIGGASNANSSNLTITHGDAGGGDGGAIDLSASGNLNVTRPPQPLFRWERGF